METSLPFSRMLFLSLCILLSVGYATSIDHLSTTPLYTGVAVLVGLLFGSTVIFLEAFVKKLNLRAFNTITLGLLFGYVFGLAMSHTLFHLIEMIGLQWHLTTVSLLQSALFLSAIYLGIVLTARAADELSVCLPFIKFKSTALKKKDILIDVSALGDARIIDLASSGLLDNHLVIPRSIIKELQSEVERDDEAGSNRARRCLEIVKKLETLPHLEIRYTDSDITDIKSPQEKLVKLARVLDANILTAEINQLQHPVVDDVRIIKFQQLCNSLKPLSQTGEFITIKVQRYGKEPRQGVGYLEDGTMVVINGGAEFIGETIKAQVLSVKHTSSGRMIFCNTSEEELFSQEDEGDERDEEDEEDELVREELVSTGTPLRNENDSRYFTL